LARIARIARIRHTYHLKFGDELLGLCKVKVIGKSLAPCGETRKESRYIHKPIRRHGDLNPPGGSGFLRLNSFGNLQWHHLHVHDVVGWKSAAGQRRSLQGACWCWYSWPPGVNGRVVAPRKGRSHVPTGHTTILFYYRVQESSLASSSTGCKALSTCRQEGSQAAEKGGRYIGRVGR
jgi:hypothetical protein